MSELVLKRCGAERIDECIEVFRGSLIWERYFSEDDRLRRSLGKAAERGELWCAFTPEGDIAGAMRVVPRGFCGLYHYLALIGSSPVGVRTCLLVSDFNLHAIEFYRSLGYWELGVIPDASKPGIAEHVMLKDLSAAEVEKP